MTTLRQFILAGSSLATGSTIRQHLNSQAGGGGVILQLFGEMEAKLMPDLEAQLDGDLVVTLEPELIAELEPELIVEIC